MNIGTLKLSLNNQLQIITTYQMLPHISPIHRIEGKLAESQKPW